MSDEMEAVVIKFADWNLLPPASDACQICAREHPPEDPHNQQSLHYQYWFRLREARAGREERWPTWADAMAHCDSQTQAMWRTALEERGVEVDG